VFAGCGCDTTSVRRVVLALLLIAWLRAPSQAGPDRPETAVATDPDPNAAVTAPSPAAQTPWLDLAPAAVLEARASDRRPRDHRMASAAALATVYGGFAAWAYVAWYRNAPAKDMHDIGRDGWFGVRTYAGGADKLGHAWATMVLARAGTALLDAGGWDRTRSTLVSALLAEALFFAVEWKDYYYYEFSPGDFTFNTLGALAAIALDLSPRLDELIDFRVEYRPSRQYRHNVLNPDSPCAKREPGQPSCSRWNVAEDYSGQNYLLALHLGAIHSLRDWRYGSWARFVDVSLGFQSRNYKPPPTLDPDVRRTQRVFFGISLNAQGVIDHLLDRKSRLRKAGHGLFEVLTPPLTLPLLDAERGTQRVMSGGA
jgi:hypothetical protein